MPAIPDRKPKKPTPAPPPKPEQVSEAVRAERKRALDAMRKAEQEPKTPPKPRTAADMKMRPKAAIPKAPPPKKKKK